MAASNKVLKSNVFGSGPVRYQVPPEGGTLFIQIDYADAPVPSNYYVADHFYVENLGFRVQIVFGKLTEDGKKLRSKLEIYVSALSFLRTVFGTTPKFHQALKEEALARNFPEIAEGSREIEADKVQTVQANNLLMASMDGESMIDFFYISPRDVHYKVPKREDIPIEALVRVMIDPPMMLAVLNRWEAIATELSKRFPKGEDYEYDQDKMESDKTL